MHRRVLRKPDGRQLVLYAREPLPVGLEAPSPSSRQAVEVNVDA
jgi:hypothetical protein